MPEKFTSEVKQRAVAEVILGVATMTKVAERYGMSTGYLSILCSKYRSSFREDRCTDGSKDGMKRRVVGQNSSSVRQVSLVSRVTKLEHNVRALFKIINN